MAATLSVALVGCSSDDKAGRNTDGGTVRVVAQNEPVSLNAIYSSVSDAKSWGALYDGLVGNNPATNEVNDEGLLYGWERPDATTWIFKVREGVTFHNGEVFDAAAAAFTILTERDEPKANLGLFYQDIVDAKPVGNDLEITTSEPYPPLPSLLASTMAIAPGAYAKLGGDGFGAAPVGTGPFKFVSYDRGGTLRLDAYKDYWRVKPAAASLEVSWSADAQTRVGLVQTGQADLALDLTPQALTSLRDDGSVEVKRAPIQSRYYLYLNTKEGAFIDLDLRRAFAMAIDRDAIVASVFKQGGAEAYRHFFGDLYDPELTFDNSIKYDLKAAQQIVSSKGSPKITLTYANGRAPNDGQIGTAVVGMLEAAGFTVTNDQVEFSTFLERRNSHATEAAGMQIINTYPDPDDMVKAWAGGFSITQACAGEWYDAKESKALSAASDDERDAHYRDIENQVLNEEVCYVPLVKYEGIWAMNPKLSGFTEPRIGATDYALLKIG